MIDKYHHQQISNYSITGTQNLKIEWNLWIVSLSFIVGVVGSYTTTYMLYMIERVQERSHRILWLLTSCFTFGGGCIWALHFTGMLALDIGVPVTYSAWVTILSFLVAVFGAAIAFYIKFRNIFKVAATPDVESFEQVPLLDVTHGESHNPEHSIKEMFKPDKYMVLGGFFQGSAIFAMHYSGMMSMRIENVVMHYNLYIVLASYIPAWIISIFALNGLPRILQFRRQFIFAVLSTLGVFSLHYIGMYSVSYSYEVQNPPPPRNPTFDVGIPFTVVIIVCVCCFTAFTVGAQYISRQRDDLVDAIKTKRYIDALKMEKEVLEKENKQKSEFIAIASHEMRTPLHAIAGFTDLLSMSHLEKDQAENLKLARQSIKVLEFVVDNVLNFTRLNNKNITVDNKWSNVADIIYQIMLNMNVVLENPISVCFMNENTKVTSEFCDPYLLLQVVQNLVSNAYKFTISGSVVVRYKCYTDNENKQFLTISVQDTGVGISPELIPGIFEPFSQVDKTLSRRYTGTGLGLAICQHVADTLNGKIKVESTFKKGSMFTFTCPTQYVERDLLFRSVLSGSFSVEGKQDIFTTAVQEFFSKIINDQYQRSEDNGTAKHEDNVSILWKRHENGLQDIYIHVSNRYYEIKLKRPVDFTEIYYMILKVVEECKENQINPSTITYPQKDQHVIDSIIFVDPLEVRREDIIAVAEDVEHKKPGYVKTNENRREENVEETEHFHSKESSPDFKRKKILVVEDNVINQTLVIRQLTKLNYEAELAKNGQDAIDWILHKGLDAFCCILMDCQMPVMDGFEATKILRNMNVTTPILALTANVTDMSRLQSENVGMNAFLSKPLKIQDLQNALLKYTQCSSDMSTRQNML